MIIRQNTTTLGLILKPAVIELLKQISLNPRAFQFSYQSPNDLIDNFDGDNPDHVEFLSRGYLISGGKRIYTKEEYQGYLTQYQQGVKIIRDGRDILDLKHSICLRDVLIFEHSIEFNEENIEELIVLTLSYLGHSKKLKLTIYLGDYYTDIDKGNMYNVSYNQTLIDVIVKKLQDTESAFMELNLFDIPFSEAEIFQLLKAVRDSKEIQKISLIQCQVNNNHMELIAEIIQHCPTIQLLDLTRNSITNIEVFWALLTDFRVNRLISLVLNENPLDLASLKLILGIPEESPLHIDAQHIFNEQDDEDMLEETSNSIARLAENKKLSFSVKKLSVIEVTQPAEQQPASSIEVDFTESRKRPPSPIASIDLMVPSPKSPKKEDVDQPTDLYSKIISFSSQPLDPKIYGMQSGEIISLSLESQERLKVLLNIACAETSEEDILAKLLKLAIKEKYSDITTWILKVSKLRLCLNVTNQEKFLPYALNFDIPYNQINGADFNEITSEFHQYHNFLFRYFLKYSPPSLYNLLKLQYPIVIVDIKEGHPIDSLLQKMKPASLSKEFILLNDVLKELINAMYRKENIQEGIDIVGHLKSLFTCYKDAGNNATVQLALLKFIENITFNQSNFFKILNFIATTQDITLIIAVYNKILIDENLFDFIKNFYQLNDNSKIILDFINKYFADKINHHIDFTKEEVDFLSNLFNHFWKISKNDELGTLNEDFCNRAFTIGNFLYQILAKYLACGDKEPSPSNQFLLERLTLLNRYQACILHAKIFPLLQNTQPNQSTDEIALRFHQFVFISYLIGRLQQKLLMDSGITLDRQIEEFLKLSNHFFQYFSDYLAKRMAANPDEEQIALYLYLSIYGKSICDFYTDYGRKIINASQGHRTDLDALFNLLIKALSNISSRFNKFNEYIQKINGYIKSKLRRVLSVNPEKFYDYSISEVVETIKKLFLFLLQGDNWAAKIAISEYDIFIPRDHLKSANAKGDPSVKVLVSLNPVMSANTNNTPMFVDGNLSSLFTLFGSSSQPKDNPHLAAWFLEESDMAFARSALFATNQLKSKALEAGYDVVLLPTVIAPYDTNFKDQALNEQLAHITGEIWQNHIDLSTNKKQILSAFLNLNQFHWVQMVWKIDPSLTKKTIDVYFSDSLRNNDNIAGIVAFITAIANKLYANLPLTLGDFSEQFSLQVDSASCGLRANVDHFDLINMILINSDLASFSARRSINDYLTIVKNAVEQYGLMEPELKSECTAFLAKFSSQPSASIGSTQTKFNGAAYTEQDHKNIVQPAIKIAEFLLNSDVQEYLKISNFDMENYRHNQTYVKNLDGLLKYLQADISSETKPPKINEFIQFLQGLNSRAMKSQDEENILLSAWVDYREHIQVKQPEDRELVDSVSIAKEPVADATRSLIQLGM